MGKRNNILAAAEQLLAERGFYGLSMKVLADKAGIAAGTIYRYFDNKEMLMAELHQHITQEAAQTAFQGWSEQHSEKQKYDILWRNVFDAVRANPQRLAVMDMLYCMPHINQRNTDLLQDDAFLPFIEFFKKGIDEKRFHDWPIAALTALSFDSSINLAKKVLQERLEITEQLLTQVCDASWMIIQATPQHNLTTIND
ncbi:TetR family transcriptional regulator [Psychromonas marina]|uniref:TetR family transcriptional regulator n=1 Tax=Psychromonas marina TaxID=88364 RepID=A0ABQ6E028_9GAMM|nr:TetR/AcrR family transcriptional regulator [Psychromonas marina]GLS90575.1 TetR family transcriptional regulator [Psychromonas marina]